jgi:hypothetical protein
MFRDKIEKKNQKNEKNIVIKKIRTKNKLRKQTQ